MSRRERLRGETLDLLLGEWPRVLETQNIPTDTCITAAVMGASALRDLGYRARPVACRTAYGNAAALALQAEGLEYASPEWERAAEERGAYEILAGFGKEVAEGRYDGHMVIAVDERWAADPTAHQFARPDKDLVVQPHRFPIDKTFLRGEAPVAIELPDGGFGVYEATHDTGWARGHYDGWGRDSVSVGRLIADHLRRRGARDL